MPKQVPAHIRRYADPILIEGVFLHVLEHAPADTDSQKSQQQVFQFCDIAAHDDVIHHQRHQPRPHHIQRDRDQKRCDRAQIGKFVIPYVT